jgi:hypothetical protein
MFLEVAGDEVPLGSLVAIVSVVFDIILFLQSISRNMAFILTAPTILMTTAPSTIPLSLKA